MTWRAGPEKSLRMGCDAHACKYWVDAEMAPSDSFARSDRYHQQSVLPEMFNRCHQCLLTLQTHSNFVKTLCQ